MSESSDGSVIYRDKRCTKPYLSTPEHGATGWIRDGVQSYQVNYFCRDGMPKGWQRLEDFKRSEKESRLRNQLYYKANPGLLRAKIQARKKPSKDYIRPYCPGCYSMSRYMPDLIGT